MNRTEITALARELMTQHGIGHWQFKWINSYSYAGLCWTIRWDENPSRSTGRIELSWPYFEVFSDFDIRDTILHEIAHALTPSPKQRTSTGRTRYIHHGAEWKAKAKEIGCSGSRCVRQGANRPKGRYRGVCPNGHETTRQRMTEQGKTASCPRCDSRYNPKFMFTWYDNGVRVPTTHKTTLPLSTPLSFPVAAESTSTGPKSAEDFASTERERLLKILASL